MGRFVQADTVVPGAGSTSAALSAGPQAWDRYAYTNNNPVRYTDPSGHRLECSVSGEVKCGNSKGGNKSTTKPSPTSPQLDLDKDVPDPEHRSNPTLKYRNGFIEPTWDYYTAMVQLLLSAGYNWTINSSGKIDDIVLMALIISGEFGVYKGRPIYDEALGALSNQYYAEYGRDGNWSNIQCGGSCSLGEQIAWLSDMEGWYSGSIFNKVQKDPSVWESFFTDAKRAANGIESNKWFWGNTDDPSKYPGSVFIYAPPELGGYSNQKPYFAVYP